MLSRALSVRLAQAALVALAGLAAGSAGALGFGRVVNDTYLGQPLDATFSVQAEGVALARECVRAEVMSGDSKLPSHLVWVRVEPIVGAETPVRVGTRVRIEEPVVTVTLSLLCGLQSSKSFVLFVDPPVVQAPVLQPDAQPPAAASAAAVAPEPGKPWLAATSSVLPEASPAKSASAGAAPSFREARQVGSAASMRPDAAPVQSVAASAPEAASVAQAASEPAQPKKKRKSKRKPAAGKAAGDASPSEASKPASSRSTLRLDAPETAVAREAATAASAQVAQMAASMAAAAEAAASQAAMLEAAEARIRKLEQELQSMRELQQSAAKASPKPAAAAAQSGAPSNSPVSIPASWLLWGSIGLAALLAVFYLVWRRAKLREGESIWWASQMGATRQAEEPLTQTESLIAAYSDMPAVAPVAAPASLPRRDSLLDSGAPESTLPPAPARAPEPARPAPSPPESRFSLSTFGNTDLSPFASSQALMQGLRVISDPGATGLVFASELQQKAMPPLGQPHPPAPVPPAASLVRVLPLPDPGSDEAQLPAAQGAAAAEQADLPLDLSAAPFRSKLGPARVISVDELLDLEQQVDFFMVLGQDGDAIELLEQQVSGSGCRSPLPYLKLLDVYRLQGEVGAFERVREQFGARFGLQAPGWGVEGIPVRSLEQYPSLLMDLCDRWTQTDEALDWLNHQLFHCEDHGQVLDIPAYEDLLFLFLVARDLDKAASANGGESGLGGSSPGPRGLSLERMEPAPGTPAGESGPDDDGLDLKL
jgi:pilus assembly protein FimV